MIRFLDRAALLATLALPAFLLYGRALAEAMIGVVDLCFLLALLADRQPLRLRPWLVLGLAWWGWEVVCSLPVPALGLGPGGAASMRQALALGRFIVFAAALEQRVLVAAPARRAMQWVVSASALFIAGAAWEQLLTGRNFLGAPRWPDGALTGPFVKPRAGAPFVRLLFPAVLPAAAALMERRRLAARAGGVALVLLAVVTVVLIGQRMPALLTALGLLVGAALLPRLRRVAAAALLAASLALAATPVVSPPTFAKLVGRFTEQMAHFAASSYGQLYTRAAVITLAHRLHGLGFDGFRDFCADPAYFHGLPALGLADATAGGAEVCNLHPHNYYLQAATDGGLPGLVLFAALAAAWLARLGRGLGGDARGTGLLLAALVHLWPFASTGGLANLPDDGWFFLLLGWGLAEASLRRRRAQPSPPVPCP